MTDKELSQYDPGLTLRDAHELENNSLRVTSANTSVPPKYSRVDLTYNAQGSVTNAKFYKGTLAEVREITFVNDVAGSLNNTYWTLYSEYDESLYHIWYNVGGLGIDPAPANSVGIEVAIDTNEDKTIVALATKLALMPLVDFKIEKVFDELYKITNTRKGVCTDSVDNGTGFTINTVQQGSERLIKSIDIPYDGTVKYIFNEQEKKFVVVPAADVSVDVDFTPATGQDPGIINLSLVTAATEGSIVLPQDAVRFILKARNNSKLQFSFTSGQSGTTFITVRKGSIHVEEGLALTSSKTIYIQAPNDNGEVVELLYWT